MFASVASELHVTPNDGEGGRADVPLSPSALGAAARAAGVLSAEDLGVGSNDNGKNGTPSDSMSSESATDSPPQVKRVSTERSKRLYEIHRQTQQKLEAMREKSATSGCTFTPQLVATKRRSQKRTKKSTRKTEDGPVCDRLYQGSLKQRAKRLQTMEAQGKEFSFRPVLPTSNSRLATKATPTSAATGHQRAEEKSRETAEQMYRECTFTPNTAMTKTFNAKVIASKGEQPPIAVRLYAAAEAQLASHRQRKEERALAELEACTFKPDLCNSTRLSDEQRSRGGSPNTHERLHKLHGELKMKKETRREAVAAAEMQECSFSPKLVAAQSPSGGGSSPGGGDGSSGEGCGRREAGEPIYERLYKLRGKLEGREGTPDPECTFQPRLTSRSPQHKGTRLGADGKEEHGAQRMVTMYNLGRERQVSRSCSPRNYTAAKAEADEQGELALCTFKPDLSATAGSRFKAEERIQADIFEALYAVHGETPRSTERTRQAVMKECTFSPELCARKTRIGRSMSPPREKGKVFENLYTEANMQRLSRAKSAEMLQALQCPFKPTMTAKARSPRITSPTNEQETASGDGMPLPLPPSNSPTTEAEISSGDGMPLPPPPAASQETEIPQVAAEKP